MKKILQNCKKKCEKVDKQLEIYAMMRSGQHAIIHWLIAHIKEPVYYHNDILCHKGDKVYADRGRWRNMGRSIPPVKNFPWYAYNVEDISIKNIKDIKEKYKNALYISNKSGLILPRKEIRVMLLRDPFNLFASRYRFFHRTNDIRRESNKRALKSSQRTNGNSGIAWYDKLAVERWKEYAREFSGETNFLGKKHLINYNRWFADAGYRKAVIKKFGFAFTDKKLNFVPANGYGSSFDLRTKDGKAQEMDVLNRWKVLSSFGKFKNIFADKELLELAENIYPELTKEFRKKMRL
jgi:hypothetical protein